MLVLRIFPRASQKAKKQKPLKLANSQKLQLLKILESSQEKFLAKIVT